MIIRCLICHNKRIRKIISNKNISYYCYNCKHKSGRILTWDPKIKTKKTKNGYKHFTAAILVQKGNKFLLMKKKNFPYLYDVIAGHINLNERPILAAKRELKEETGITIKYLELIFHGTLVNDQCWRGINVHEWYLFIGQTEGNPKINPEAQFMRWYSKRQIQRLKFVPACAYIMRKIGLIKKAKPNKLKILNLKIYKKLPGN